VVVLGALGGPRLDHELANLLLLAHPRLDGLDVSVVDGQTIARRIGTTDGPGRADIVGAPGDLLTLLPIAGPVDGVTTHDLRYPLRGETLHPGPARGLSNELLAPTASVTTERGRLLVVHTRRTQPEEAP
jgi:thiamine pyrophosphokinase